MLSMWKLAIPAAGEQSFSLIAGLIDTYLIGHLSPAALTSVGIANQWVMFISTTFLVGISVGTTALVARATGAGDACLSQHVLQQSILLGIFLGLIGTIVLSIWYSPAIAVLNTPPEAVPLASVYLRVVSIAFPLWGIVTVGNAALRGAGDTTTPLLVMIVVNFVNVGIAWVLIRGVAGFPQLGVLGAALGDMGGRVVGGVVVAALLIHGKGDLHLSLRHLNVDSQMIKRILNIGLPSGVERFSFRIGMMTFSGIIASLGNIAYAAHQVAVNSEALSYMPGFGFAVASSTLVGQSLGASWPDRARKSGYLSYKVGALFMALMGVVFVLFAGDIMGIFSNDPRVIAAGTTPLRLAGIAQPLLAAALVFSNSLRGAGDTRFPMLINGLSVWAVRVPLAYLFAIKFGWGLNGAWLAMAIDIAVRGSLNFFRFRSGKWALVKV